MTIASRAAGFAALCISLAAVAAAGLGVAQPAPASAAPGGLSAYSSSLPGTSPPGTETTSPDTEAPSAPAGRAMLVSGRAIAPLDAPPAVKRVIAAANSIRAKPYIWGGGHARWWDRGYDCSGAVSFALHGGRLLESPLPSGPMERWGSPGPGRWISVYANAGHAYAVIAGLRWDTSGNTSGTGPRWHPDMASNRGFVVRHPEGY